MGSLSLLSLMNQPLYTAIPDTTDRAYWRLKTDDLANGLQRFVPIDPQLHRHLKALAWPALQAKKAKKFKDFPPQDSGED